MLDIRTTAPATDRRILVPVDIVHETGLAPNHAERLSDRVSGLIESSEDLMGRPLWRQSYEELSDGIDTEVLPFARWPIEGIPTISDVHENPVEFGDEPLARVTGRNRWGVYRSRGWSRPARRNRLTGNKRWAPSHLEWKMTYTGGFLMPGQIFTWLPESTVVEGGSRSSGSFPGWTLPTDISNPLAFFADIDGTTGNTEPVWPSVVGEAIVDNGITWTATEAAVLTRDLLGFADAVMQLAHSLVVQTEGCATIDGKGVATLDPKLFENATAAVRAYK